MSDLSEVFSAFGAATHATLLDIRAMGYFVSDLLYVATRAAARGLTRADTYNRQMRPQGKHTTAMMIPKTPYFFVGSCWPAALMFMTRIQNERINDERYMKIS